MERLWQRLGLLVLPMALAVVFGPAIAQGLVLAPADGMAIYLPFRAIGFEAVRHLEWPFWNPFDFGGTPLFAALQGGFLFPGNWTFLTFPPVVAMNVSVVLSYAVAGFGTLLLVRARGLGLTAALVAGLVFMLSGFMIAHLEHLSMIQAASLLPILLWASERYLGTGRVRFAVAWCLVLTAQILAGHPQMIVLSLLLAVPWVVWCSQPLAWPDRARHFSILALMGCLALGLSAIQLLPTLDFIGETNRQGFTYDQLVAESLPPRQVLGLLFPFLFGAPPSAWFPVPPWGAGPWFDEFVGYAGLPTLVLAALALCRWRQVRDVRFWAIVGVIALLLTLGGYTPLYKLWAQVPFLKTFRAPARHFLEVDLAIAMLSAYGVQSLVERIASRKQAFGAWAALGLPLLALVAGIGLVGAKLADKWQPFMPAGVHLREALTLHATAVWLPVALWLVTGLLLTIPTARRGHAWRLALVLLVMGDLSIFAIHQGWRQQSPQLPLTLGRDLVARATPERSLSIPLNAYPYHHVDEVLRVHAGGYGALLGERSVGGYDAFIKRRYADLLGGMTHGGVMTRDDVWGPGHHALDVLNTRHLRVSAAVLDDAAWSKRLEAPRWKRLPAHDGVVVFENRNALPPAWRVTRVTQATADQVNGRMTSDAAFAPGREALVEAHVPLQPWAGGSVTVQRPTLNRLSVTTDGPGPGFIVVSEGYDAGWHAFQGDRELPVYRVDGLLLGVEVPAGRHTIEWRYEPGTWRLGCAVTLASIVLLIVALFFYSRRSRKAYILKGASGSQPG